MIVGYFVVKKARVHSLRMGAFRCWKSFGKNFVVTLVLNLLALLFDNGDSAMENGQPWLVFLNMLA